MNPDIQTKLREEIDVTLGKLGGQITYDGVQSMKYLSQVIDGKKFSLYYNTSITGLQNREGLCLIKLNFIVICLLMKDLISIVLE